MDCDALLWNGSFDIPAAYAPVSEPGGINIVRKTDGSEWHPYPSDIAKLGVQIETSPTDGFTQVPLRKLSQTQVEGGEVYSRVVCHELACVVEATFVPTSSGPQATKCGVLLRRIDLDGQSSEGLAAAERLVRFRWSFAQHRGSLALDELGQRHPSASDAR